MSSLIAIMLGRLQMSVDDCISHYRTLSERVFGRRGNPVTNNFKLVMGISKFDAAELEAAIKEVIRQSGYDTEELLKELVNPKCKV
jgi:hypothetical protein